VNPGVSTREPTVPQLLTGLMQDAQQLLRQEVALATHELRRELRTTLRAVMSLGISIGIAAIGGWLLILMLVHLLQALTALPRWAYDGIVGGLLAAGGIGLLVLGTQTLAQLHLMPQDTVDTMKENVQWLKEQVRPNSRATRDRPR
jgi:Putative Actinobacterial Holin-X, holin superfamily III